MERLWNIFFPPTNLLLQFDMQIVLLKVVVLYDHKRENKATYPNSEYKD